MNVFGFVGMSIVQGDSTLKSGLQPNILNDISGPYIVITCGSFSGQLYITKLVQSKRVQSKCVLVNGKWYTPSGFETLAGKRTKKWKQSLLHQGKPLPSYNLTGGFGNLSQDSQSQASATNVTDNVGLVSSVSDKSSTCSVNVLSGPSCSLGSDNSIPCDPTLYNTFLAFIKAYRLRGDVDSLKKVAYEHFSSDLVDRAKKALWDVCGNQLETANLPFQARRDSDNRSHIDDIIRAFEVLDLDNSIPSIFCEASELLKLPPLSLDPIGEQVHANTEALVNLKSSIACLSIRSLVSLSHLSLNRWVLLLTVIDLEMFLINNTNNPAHMLRLLP